MSNPLPQYLTNAHFESLKKSVAEVHRVLQNHAENPFTLELPDGTRDYKTLLERSHETVSRYANLLVDIEQAMQKHCKEGTPMSIEEMQKWTAKANKLWSGGENPKLPENHE